MTPLRQRVSEDMQVRNLAAHTAVQSAAGLPVRPPLRQIARPAWAGRNPNLSTGSHPGQALFRQLHPGRPLSNDKQGAFNDRHGRKSALTGQAFYVWVPPNSAGTAR